MTAPGKLYDTDLSLLFISTIDLGTVCLHYLSVLLIATIYLRIVCLPYLSILLIATISTLPNFIPFSKTRNFA